MMQSLEAGFPASMGMRHPAFIALLLLAFALRLGLGAFRGDLGHTPDPDYREYVHVANGLLRHGTFTSPVIFDAAVVHPSGMMPPAYAFLVAGMYWILGIESGLATLALQILNALATTAAVAVAFAVGRRLAGIRAAWLAAVITALNPTIAGFTHLLWDTSLFTLGTAVTVWLAAYLSERPTKKASSFLLGLWLGILALLNPALTLAYPVIVLWMLMRSGFPGFGRLFRSVVLAVLGWAVVVAPWSIRHYVHFDRLIYIRNGMMQELWLGSCPEAESNPGEIFNARYPLRNKAVHDRVVEIGEREYLDECARQAREAIAADPWRWVRLCGRRLVDYWLGTIYTHVPPASGGWPPQAWRAGLALAMIAELIAVVALVVLRTSRRGGAARADAFWLLGVVFAFSVVYCLTHIQIRYRAPSEPVLAIALALLAFPGRSKKACEE